MTSPSEFRNWLDPADLPTLLDLAGIAPTASPRWIRHRDGRAGKFLAGLDTIEFGWEELNDALSAAEDADELLDDVCEMYDDDDKVTPNAWFAWLATKKDDSLLRLYQLIGFGARDHELYCALEDVPIVRIRKGNAVSHVRGSATFLPDGRSDKDQSRVPIDLAYFEDDEDATRSADLKAFYRAVGTKRWDESARTEQKLEAYRDRDRAIPDGDELTQHLEDIRAFIRYGAKPGNVRSQLADVPMFLAGQSGGGQRWVTPRETFVDLPFEDTGLSSLYPREPLVWGEGSRKGQYAYDREPYALAGIYHEVEGIVDFVGSLDAKTGIEITKADVTKNIVFLQSWSLRYDRVTDKGQRFDWSIDRLDDIIETGDHNLLRALWSTVVVAHAAKAFATYQANARAQQHRMMSQLARTLTSTPWVLNRDGDLKLPREVSVEDLPDDWQVPHATSLVYKLDFGSDAIRRRQKHEGVTNLLREEGLPENTLDVALQAQELGLDLAAFVREHAAISQFPDGPSEDPVRRAAVAAVDAVSAPEYSTSIRERSVVDGQSQASAESKAYLRAQYTTTAGEMHCQACREPLPFKTKDGSWYFEAVRLVNARKQVHTANAIALCPLCAARYKYARGTKNEAILDELDSTTIDVGQGTVEIPVVLDGKRIKLGFTGKHAIDVKTALGVAGDERPETD